MDDFDIYVRFKILATQKPPVSWQGSQGADVSLRLKFSNRRAISAFREACGFRLFEGNPARFMVGFRHIEVEGADGAVCGPRQAHHGGQPGQGAYVALPDAVRRQRQPAQSDRPQQGADIGNETFRKLHHTAPNCFANL